MTSKDFDSEDSESESYVLGKLSAAAEASQEECRIGTTTVLTFPPPLSFPRSIQISEDSSGGCGGKTWEAAQVLCDHLVYRWTQDKSCFVGKRILELGAGTGCVGILAAMLVAGDAAVQPEPTMHDPPLTVSGEVVITDMLFLELMQKNVELNLRPDEVRRARVEELKWGTPLSERVQPPYDFILAADCVYLEAAFDPLIQTLLEVIGPSTEAIIVSKKRRKADRRFFDKLKKQFSVVEIKEDPKYQQIMRQSITIVSVRKKQS